MSYFKENIISRAKENSYFRRELFTGSESQLVLMSLNPHEDIGEEIHSGIDQILFFVEGSGKAIIDGSEIQIQENDVLFIRRGSKHNVVNTSSEKMKLVSVYSPPEHARGTVHQTKSQAIDAEQ
ncbi:MAG: hypothetical protein A2418_02760 [Candidatus Brennerbacteria bacterium RIFOXYC1_FULL_41_11]|uniref:Cupin type-2 domain-containing protein n=1 Tax=Candidatus Brennerbacteria bacterium RIFOXYD1_FULL_41_16 TaxID=1797529 RepID=A0A1G1XJW8_9BACT|nr:MAG: hypothetical protein A2391_02515 [Candidatus Brennerbacteria bacterium RIFOXYB1_FULL_41_13]OGY39096.1 MAG: hypothetical protein A2418_02760 [Candidatus Brennerbacteria bacterium RIFOXYC1_FULL_41_11]OGY40251.1 MAG: hypothetical protein A2570_03145 [Candidatus Brennerbacteria bacterium RIFOXYD1_FULL_41_16]